VIESVGGYRCNSEQMLRGGLESERQTWKRFKIKGDAKNHAWWKQILGYHSHNSLEGFVSRICGNESEKVGK